VRLSKRRASCRCLRKLGLRKHVLQWGGGGGLLRDPVNFTEVGKTHMGGVLGHEHNREATKFSETVAFFCSRRKIGPEEMKKAEGR